MPPIEELKLSLVKVEGRDDLAYVLSTNRTSMALPGVPGPVKDSGKSVVMVVERRQPDGRWLIEADISNSDLPAAPPQN